MIASNELDYKRFNPTKGKVIHARRIKLVQSGIDPEESFNMFRGGLLVTACMLVVIGVICWVLL
jgi:hypothetical protein